MIICEFKKGQGLGNQLWNYAVARSIAENLSMNFQVLGYDNFKGINFLDLFQGEDNISLNDTNIFLETLYYDNDLKYLCSSFDDKILNLKANTKLEGLFQSEKYFFGNINRIKQYIDVTKIKNFNNITPQTCILNIRGGEYKMHKKFLLPKDYWIIAMKKMREIYSINNFIIVTDDRKYAKALFPDLDVISDNIEKCFSAILYCKYIVISNSTFSYFPIKLSNESKIVFAPKHWARFNNKYNRWASPANIYKDWFWLSKNGNIENYEDCLKIAIDTDNLYKNTFNIHHNKIFENFHFKNLLSDKLKKYIKLILSYLFPKHFG
jgi:hypothetical protein